jgi:hypothetical protein
MINIVELYEKIQNNHNIFNIIDLSRGFNYLANYKLDSLIIVGCKPHPRFHTINSFNKEKLKTILHKYNIFVLDKGFCKLPNNDILNLLDFFSKHKKKLIVVGYQCYVNVNIDNTNNMFRPIDITKYPFNQTKSKTIYKSYSIKLIIFYIFCCITIFLGHKRDPRVLYKIVLLILILFPFIFPTKKVLFIDFSNNRKIVN